MLLKTSKILLILLSFIFCILIGILGLDFYLKKILIPHQTLDREPTQTVIKPEIPDLEKKLIELAEKSIPCVVRVQRGTGFIISSDGLILTAKHLVKDKKDIYVILDSEKEYTAEVLILHPNKDIAIIKIKKTNLPICPLGNSDDIKVGQMVIAISNVRTHFRNSVSLGVISGLSRELFVREDSEGEVRRGLIQTDAIIVKGSSGAPLLNLSGEVIGIFTAMAETGVGLAIPINEAKNLIREIETHK
jgi:S1-C subfamily serine protease